MSNEININAPILATDDEVNEIIQLLGQCAQTEGGLSPLLSAMWSATGAAANAAASFLYNERRSRTPAKAERVLAVESRIASANELARIAGLFAETAGGSAEFMPNIADIVAGFDPTRNGGVTQVSERDEAELLAFLDTDGLDMEDARKRLADRIAPAGEVIDDKFIEVATCMATVNQGGPILRNHVAMVVRRIAIKSREKAAEAALFAQDRSRVQETRVANAARNKELATIGRMAASISSKYEVIQQSAADPVAVEALVAQLIK